MATFFDDFERANGAPGNNWNNRFATFTISGGSLVANLAYGQCLNTTISSTGRLEASAHVTWANYNGQRAGPVVKGSLTGSAGFALTIHGSNPDCTLDISAVTANGTVLASAPIGASIPPWFELRIVWDNGHISGYYQGQLIVELDSASYYNEVYAGVVGQSANCIVTDFRMVTDAAVGLDVTETVVGNFGECTELHLTGTSTAWTPGTPGSPTFTVDHGTISVQQVLTATTATVTYCPGDFLGTATFTDPSTGATDSVLVSSDPDLIEGGGECKLTDDGAGIVNDTGAIKRPGTLLTTSDIVRLAPTMNITASLDYLITLVRNLYNPAPEWPDGEPAPDVRLDVLWDWVSGGATMVGLPQTPNTSDPIKVDTEIIRSVVESLTSSYDDLADVVGILGGTPIVYSHADLKTAIDNIDLSSVLTKLDKIQPNELNDLSQIVAMLTNLQGVRPETLTSISDQVLALNPATAPGLAAATASILGAIAGVALEVVAVGTAETADAASSAAAAAGIVGVAAEIAGIIATLADIVSDIAAIKAGMGSETYHPPVWPGLAHVVMGASQDLQGGLVVPGPMHGVRVQITSCDPGTSFYDYDVVRNWRNAGALSFTSDVGDQEQFQPLGWQNGIYVPLHMTYAASCKLHLGRGPQGTITPWSYAP